MTSWKKDETTFEVKVFTLNNRDGSRTRMCTIPSPLMRRFGEPERMRFEVMGDGTVRVGPAER